MVLDLVHLAATYLEPTLREFLFVPSAKDRSLFIQQAENCIMAYGEDEYDKRRNLYTSPATAATASSETQNTQNRTSVPTTGDAVIPEQEEQAQRCDDTQLSSKRQKLDTTNPLTAFRRGVTSTSTSTGAAGTGVKFNYNTLDEYKAALSQDLRKYIDMKGPFETSTSAARVQDCDDVFDLLLWWSKSSCKLPLGYSVSLKSRFS